MAGAISPRALVRSLAPSISLPDRGAGCPDGRATIEIGVAKRGGDVQVSVVPPAIDATAETLRVAVAAESDAAGREENQDLALALALSGPSTAPGEDFLLVVADGMGGEPAGDVASRIAVDTLRDALAEMPQGDLGQALKLAYRKANEAVYRAAVDEPTYTGMGTTLTSALLHGKYATVAHVGDSRAYLLRGDGLTQITRDHTVVADEVAQGRISAEAARRDPRRNILTQAIGSHAKLDSRLPSIFELTLLPDDRLLLCSDGLYDVLPDDDLRRALSAQDPTVAAKGLVTLAKDRGTRDNATAVVAAAIPTRVPAVPLTPVAPARTGGIPGTLIAAAVAILLLVLLVLAVFLLGAPR
jgi:serine/threonine protein phosphatase PrpC